MEKEDVYKIGFVHLCQVYLYIHLVLIGIIIYEIRRFICFNTVQMDVAV